MGLSCHFSFGLAVLLTLLTLLTALLATLLLLTGLLLPTLLLAALLLATLLLLAGLLVWILIHRTFLSNVGSKRHHDRLRPMARDNAWRVHSFPFTAPLNFDENVFGTRAQQQEFPIHITERRTMGRYMLLWLLGVPIPILVLIWLFGGLH